MELRQFFCSHVWEDILREKVDKPRRMFLVVQRCKKCGKIKKIEIKY